MEGLPKDIYSHTAVAVEYPYVCEGGVHSDECRPQQYTLNNTQPLIS